MKIFLLILLVFFSLFTQGQMMGFYGRSIDDKAIENIRKESEYAKSHKLKSIKRYRYKRENSKSFLEREMQFDTLCNLLSDVLYNKRKKWDRKTIYKYDSLNKLISVESNDYLPNSPVITTLKYNDNGKVVEIANEKTNYKIRYSYLDNGNLDSIIFSNRKPIMFFYDKNKLQFIRSEVGCVLQEFTYDTCGNLIKSIRDYGDIYECVYQIDSLGRTTNEIYYIYENDSTNKVLVDTRSYSFDNKGNIVVQEFVNKIHGGKRNYFQRYFFYYDDFGLLKERISFKENWKIEYILKFEYEKYE